MTIIDPGHKYSPHILDGSTLQTLQFVKRMGSNYPGNKSAYSGTNLQSVLRCCTNRTNYLQKQSWCLENILIRMCLRLAIWLLEFRAARRHGRIFLRSLHHAETSPMCSRCGHVVGACGCTRKGKL